MHFKRSIVVVVAIAIVVATFECMFDCCCDCSHVPMSGRVSVCQSTFWPRGHMVIDSDDGAEEIVSQTPSSRELHSRMCPLRSAGWMTLVVWWVVGRGGTTNRIVCIVDLTKCSNEIEKVFETALHNVEEIVTRHTKRTSKEEVLRPGVWLTMLPEVLRHRRASDSNRG